MAPVWFITAASSGFGRYLAWNAIKRGHTVIATARKPDSIKDLADAGADVMPFDVTSPLDELKTTVKKVFEKHGRVDYLVNVAGYILEAAIEEATPEEVYQNFNTNVFGTINTTQAFLPKLREQPLDSKGVRSTIVTFGSIGSWAGVGGGGIYCMTKCCMSSLAESLHSELEPFKIRATTIEPGVFRTSLMASGAAVHSEKRIDAYEDKDTPSGQLRAAWNQYDGNQPGNAEKAAEVIFDALTGTGIGAGKEFPPRLVIGSDCEKLIREKCQSTLKLLDDWKGVAKSTDYE